jgi:hypothetical protein
MYSNRSGLHSGWSRRWVSGRFRCLPVIALLAVSAPAWAGKVEIIDI